MRVQHPEKRQFEIAPVGEPSFLTDDKGIAEVDSKLGQSLVKQGWAELKSGKSADKE